MRLKSPGPCENHNKPASQKVGETQIEPASHDRRETQFNIASHRLFETQSKCAKPLTQKGENHEV